MRPDLRIWNKKKTRAMDESCGHCYQAATKDGGKHVEPR